MGRPTTANACNQRLELQVTLASKPHPQVVACSRSEGHHGDHYARIAWPPRLAPAKR
jgi:hypothetical protein